MTDYDISHMPGAGALIANALRVDERDEQQRAAEALAAAWASEGPDELAIGDAILEGEPPADLAVGADLPPQRTRLLRYRAWIEALRDALGRMQQGRADFLEQMGAPAVTEAELREIVEGDKRGLLAWMLGGGKKTGTSMPPVRVFERGRLEARFADDTHLAEVAKAAMDGIEAQIDLRTREIAALERRESEFIHDAMLEIAAEEYAAAYREQIAALEATTRALLGLDVVVRGRRGFTYGGAHSANVTLPRFGFPGQPAERGAQSRPAIAVSAEDAAAAARPWRALEALLRHDPRVSQVEAAALIAADPPKAQTTINEEDH